MASRNLPIVDWLEIDSSAPGKFIISGEYSVVYEKQAIAATIDLRTNVVIRPNKEGKVRVDFKNLNTIREWPTASLTMCRLVNKYSECLDFNDSMPVKLGHLLHARYQENKSPSNSQEGTSKSGISNQEKKADDAAMAFLLLYIGLGDSYASSARPPLNVEIDSSIPVGSGLGSSSAFSVALCGALMRVFRVTAEKYIISNWAFNIDRFFHGRPSGVDNNVIANGGYILFQTGKIKATGIQHKSPIRVMLINTGVSRSTKALSEIVIKQLRDDSVRVNNIFNSINDITTQIWRKINDVDFVPANISNYLISNQALLDSLGVGHERLSDICARAMAVNLSAKQTGAGGGGFAFVLYDESEDCPIITRLRAELTEANYTVHDHNVGCEGLKVDIVSDPEKRFPVGDR